MVEQVRDRRRSRRIPGRFLISMLVGEPGAKDEYRAFVVDLSELGLRVRTDIELAPGQTVDVVFTEPVLSRVVWSARLGSTQEFEAGLEIVRQPVRAETLQHLESRSATGIAMLY